MAEITNGEVKSVFKSASDYRSSQKTSMNPLSRLSGLKKDKIEFNDLYSAWVKNGSPDDTDDIANMLKDQFGYSDKEVGKIFDNVFGKDQEPAGHVVSKLADYIKSNDLTDDVVAFIEKEYKDTLFNTKQGLFKRKKAVYEDIRRIFEMIKEEDRTARESVLKSHEQQSLGRSRK